MVGTTVLRGFNIRLDPSIRTSMRYDPLNQCSSKCFKHNRRFFGKDVLQIAWIHAWKKKLTFGNAERIFGSFYLLLAWKLHSRATQCGICRCFTDTRPAKQPSYVTNYTALRDQSRWRIAGDLNLLRRPTLDPEKKIFGCIDYFFRRDISFLPYFEHFKQHLLWEWRF